MSAAQIRTATPADAEALALLEAEAFAEGAWDLGSLRTLLEPGSTPEHLVVLHEAHGDLAAYAVFQRVLDEAELLRVAVYPAERRRGLARELLTEALGRLGALGVRSCHLEVRADNRAALGLYRELGFEPVGLRRGYYRDGCDALLWTRSGPVRS